MSLKQNAHKPTLSQTDHATEMNLTGPAAEILEVLATASRGGGRGYLALNEGEAIIWMSETESVEDHRMRDYLKKWTIDEPTRAALMASGEVDEDAGIPVHVLDKDTRKFNGEAGLRSAAHLEAQAHRYSFRAEAAADVTRLLRQVLPSDPEFLLLQVSPVDIGCIKVECESSLPLDKMAALIGQVEDGHVMGRTLQSRAVPEEAQATGTPGNAPGRSGFPVEDLPGSPLRKRTEMHHPIKAYEEIARKVADAKNAGDTPKALQLEKEFRGMRGQEVGHHDHFEKMSGNAVAAHSAYMGALETHLKGPQVAPALESKVQVMLAGEQVVLSDKDCDAIAELDAEWTGRFATLPNPKQVGILDAWVGFIKIEEQIKAGLTNGDLAADAAIGSAAAASVGLTASDYEKTPHQAVISHELALLAAADRGLIPYSDPRIVRNEREREADLKMRRIGPR